MESRKVLNRGIKMTLLGALAAALTYVLANMANFELAVNVQIIVTAVLMGILSAVENAIKHRGEVPQ